MTEAEWLACTDPMRMLEFLRDKASDRKFRLFAVACCRRIWHLLDWHGRSAVEVAEQFADGMATEDDLETVNRKSARRVDLCGWGDDEILTATTESLAAFSASTVAQRVVSLAGLAEAQTLHAAAYGSKQLIDVGALAKKQKAVRIAFVVNEREAQRQLLHCIFFSPFCSFAINRAWLAWNDGTVHRIAQAIYDDRAFDRLPILADALEDAGCAIADILTHCRSGGEHVRGCWVVDLLLGKS